jgi:hypothetical protein
LARVAFIGGIPAFSVSFLSFPLFFVDGAFSRAAFPVVFLTAVAAGGGVLSTRFRRRAVRFAVPFILRPPL